MAQIDLRSSSQDGSEPTGELPADTSPQLASGAPAPRSTVEPTPAVAAVPLSDVLARARFTPAQAAALVGDALEALAAGWAAGRSLQLSDPARITLTRTGWLQLPYAVIAPPGEQPPHRRDLAALGRLVSEILAASSQPADPRNGSTTVLRLLHRAARLRDEAGALRLADELRLALGEPSAAHPRAELAALVDRITGEAGQVEPAVPAPRLRLHRVTARSAPPVVSPVPLRTPHPFWSGLFRSVALLLVLVIVLGAEYAFLGDRILQDLHRLAPQIPSSATGRRPAAKHHPAPPLRPVPVLAPAAAGVVTAVDLRALGLCRPGASCRVRLLVALRGHRQPLPVRWSYTVVDRCSARTLHRTGGSARVAAGRRQLTVLDRVSLPPARALAVVAVASSPARVAAPALSVPGTGGSCPRTTNP